MNGVEEGQPLPGHPVNETELQGLGFTPLSLVVTQSALPIESGTACQWDTVGSIPERPGHYLFTVEDGGSISVTYVGKTDHLWMVTKGHLPHGGGPRGGNRYGHPKHAGTNRRRINVLLAEQLALGRSFGHWVRPLGLASDDPGRVEHELLREEDELINRWDLRKVGWNIK